VSAKATTPAKQKAKNQQTREAEDKTTPEQ